MKLTEYQQLIQFLVVVRREMDRIVVFPAKHFVTSKDKIQRAVKDIEEELEERLLVLNSQNKLVESSETGTENQI